MSHSNSNGYYDDGVSRRTDQPPGYDPRAFPAVAVTVDMVVLTYADEKLRALLIERGAQPYQGSWALPGGFVHENETLDEAARRELTEETGVDVAPYLRQFHTYGDPDRDPRLRVVTVVYLAVVPHVGEVTAGTDARHATLVPVDEVLRTRPRHRLAFDHALLLRDAVEEARSMLETTSIATSFVNTPFTLTELRGVYEAAWGQQLDPGNFRRKVLSTPGFVIPTGHQARSGPEGGKPPDLYRPGRATRLDPALRRPPRARSG
jgi:8-oxo-dGTP diphosphatase